MELKIRTKEQQMIDAFKKYIKTKGNVTLDYSLEAYMQVALDHISSLEKENQELKKQLDYLRSGEYLNQLKFEVSMLEDIVANGKVSEEDKRFIDMTHRNTELLEENRKLRSKLDYALKLLSDIYPPCEIDGFMDKHSDYCQMNCGVDEDVFKKCWLLYIEEKLNEVE